MSVFAIALSEKKYCVIEYGYLRNDVLVQKIG